MKDSLIFPQSIRLLKVLTVCMLVALTACEKEDPQQFIKEGRSLFDKGDTESARVQFQNALQIQPKLADAYYGLALIDEKKQDWKSMFGNLLETAAIDPNHLMAQVKLGQIYLLSGQLDKAKEQANIVLKLNPESIDALIFQGSLKSREGDNTEALQITERVLAKDKANVDAIGLKASVLSQEKRYDEALATLNSGLEAHPEDVGIKLLRIRLQTDRKNYDEAVRDFEELIAKHPENNTYRFALVDFLTNIKKPEQAEKVLRDAIAKNPDDVDLKLKLIDYIEPRNADQSELLLKEFIAASPKELRLKSRLARYYGGRNRIPEEQAILNEIITADAKGKDGLAAKVALGEIAWMQRDKATAGKLADEVIAVDPGNSDALLLRASVLLDKKDTDKAISDLRIVLRDQPNSERAILMMAQAHLQKDEVEVAEGQWRKVLEVNPGNISALMPLVSQFLKRGDTVRAEELLVKALNANPGNPELLELMLQVKVAKKDWAGADAIVSDLRKMPQGEFVAQMWTGLLALQRGHYDEAISNFKQVLTKNPDMPQALVEITKAYEGAGKRQELIGYLQSFNKTNPKNITAYELLSSTYIAEKRWDEAEKILKEAVKNVPDKLDFKLKLIGVLDQLDEARAEAMLKEFIAANPKEIRLKARLAGFYAGRKRYAEAETILKEGINADPTGRDGVSARLRLAQIALMKNDLPAALASTDEILKIDAGNVDALLIRSDVRLNQKDVDGAIADLQQLLKDHPKSDRAMILLSQAFLAKGDNASAESQWQKSLEINPGNMEALSPLVSQLIKRRDHTRAEEYLSKALKVSPGNPQILESLINVRISKKDWVGAQAAVNELRKLPHGSLPALMFGGVLAANQGHYPEAIKAYQEVLAKKPEFSEALIAMAQASDAAGRRNELISFLKAFIQKNPKNISAYNTLGMAYAAEKQWDDANKTLQEALKLDPKSISTYKVYAGVLMQQGKKAEVVELYHKASENLPENPQIMMELAKHYERTKDLSAAIATYNSMIKKFPEYNEAANNLADLLANSDAGQEGLKQAMTLAERFKDSPNPYFLDTYGWVLFKSGEIDKALDVLKKAVSLAPDIAAMRYHLGEVYHAAGANSASKVELEKSLSLAEQQGNFDGIERAKELLNQVGASAGN